MSTLRAEARYIVPLICSVFRICFTVQAFYLTNLYCKFRRLLATPDIEGRNEAALIPIAVVLFL